MVKHRNLSLRGVHFGDSIRIIFLSSDYSQGQGILAMLLHTRSGHFCAIFFAISRGRCKGTSQSLSKNHWTRPRGRSRWKHFLSKVDFVFRWWRGLIFVLLEGRCYVLRPLCYAWPLVTKLPLSAYPTSQRHQKVSRKLTILPPVTDSWVRSWRYCL